MYYYRAVFKFFCDINTYNLIFCLFMGLISGFTWSVLLFNSIGIGVGLLGYHSFKKQEWLLYANLGLTKIDLIRYVWVCNCVLTAPLLLLASYLLFA